MFDITTLTGIHTWLSLIAIASGVVVTGGLFASRRLPGWTALFLATAVAASATGYLFPFNGVLPSHIVGAVALVVLVAALAARYPLRLSGAARWIYVAGAVASLYLLVFVGVAQAFAKIPALKAMAPTQAEPPFAIAQGVVLLIFLGIGVLAARSFHPAGPLTGLRQAQAR
ncbi:hypothetical protein [Azorhizobium doebereinerae]|uniref:hypothetical protein n=1 Tax=Azorhizobium doebereinerae TaxID=281091 RepID=UPI0003F95D1E|nr:hypothetical protein [Azorhizobium doebereinerae]